jgi:hypothetical protein
MIDFSEVLGDSAGRKPIDPSKIFDLLPKQNSRYAYLRANQAGVLEQWMGVKEKRDLIAKMNTGAGKTLLGILMLQSSLNEGIYPAIYLCPDKYLANQVMAEARELEIQTVDDPADEAFRHGEVILVSNVFKLFNGKSVFGIGASRIPIGAIVLDDAHTCIERIQEQFTLNVPAGEAPETYKALVGVFQADLEAQSTMGKSEIEAGDARRVMRVTYWAFEQQFPKVLEILNNWENKPDFVWPLVKEHLRFSRCFISGAKVSFSFPCLPVEVLPSFCDAQRRIYLTATLARDEILVSDLGAESTALSSPLSPQQVSDLGDRMIVVPQIKNIALTDDELRKFVKEKSLELNCVVIVPSHARAELWKEYADEIVDASNLQPVVSQLRSRRVGLVVLVNKYDGVDLPGDACRILVLDDLPSARGLSTRYEDSVFKGSVEFRSRLAHRIEQGMGRGIRAADDFCVVLLMGSRLVDFLNDPRSINEFTPATKAQYALVRTLLRQYNNFGAVEFAEFLNYCLHLDPKWKQASRRALVDLPQIEVRDGDFTIAAKRREAFKYASINQHSRAIECLQAAVNVAPDNATRGWLKQELAENMNRIDPVAAQNIQRSAIVLNSQLLKPIDGIEYIRVNPLAKTQAENGIEWLQKFNDPNSAAIRINAIGEDLVFSKEHTEEFEQAMCDLAGVLGFAGQRPERDFRDGGPDVLWSVGGSDYWVIECKSGSDHNSIPKRDADQLSGAMVWFRGRYDQATTATPILVHPLGEFDQLASFAPPTRVIEEESLTALRTALRGLAGGLGSLHRIPSVAE